MPQGWLAFSIPSDPTSWVLVVGILATAYVFLKAKRKGQKSAMSGPPPFANLSTQRKIDGAMTELLVELEQMSRQISAQLDTRAARLDELIRQADERIARLEQLERGDTAQQPEPAPIAPEMPPAPPLPEPIPINPRHADIYRLSDQGLVPGDIASAVGLPMNEVELILALRRRERRAGGSR
jgi:hypothetical protein